MAVPVLLPAPPPDKDVSSPAWKDWFYKLKAKVEGIVTSFNTRIGDITLTQADILAVIGNYVTTFNTRIGAVTLTAADVNAVVTITNTFNGRSGTVVLTAADVYGVMQTKERITPSTGATVAITKNITLVDTGALVTLTCTLPTAPIDGFRSLISTVSNITTLTVNPGGADSIKDGFGGSILAGVSVEYIYNTANTTWYRIQ